jgi:F-type H+-transporting ATPase subunit gamma
VGEEGEALLAVGGEEYIYEPDAASLLGRLLPNSIELQVFQAMLESEAAEHASRMTAMDNATRNASEMINALTLQYNRARQAYITKELIEIVSGAESLKG